MRFFTRILLCFVGFSLIPATLFFVAYFASVHYAQRNVLQTSRETVMASGGQIEELLQVVEQDLSQLALDNSIADYLETPNQKNELQATRRLYYQVSGKADYLALYLIRADAAGGIGTDMVPPLYHRLSNRTWGIFRMMEDAGNQIIMRAGDHSSLAQKNTVISFGKKIVLPSGKTGYVIADIAGSLFEMNFPSLSNGTTYIYINNNVIYNSNQRLLIGLDQLPDYVAELETGLHRNDKNMRISIVYVPIYREQIQIVQVLSLENQQQAFRYMLWGLLVTIVLLFVVCPLIAYYVAQNISLPIRQMSTSLREVEKGNFDIRLELKRKDEIGKMAEQFNRMAAQTKDLIHNIRNKQSQLDISRNRALLAQVNPHFLYNTLDLIHWGAKMNDLKMVSDVTVKLGRLLRASVNIEDDVITVRRELAFIELYIGIQKLRYGDRMQYSVDVSEDLLEKRIPRLIFQPLVENAFEHGIQKIEEVGIVKIVGEQEGHYLIFRVMDNGGGFPEGFSVDDATPVGVLQGIGIANVARRARLYGDETCGVRIEQTADGMNTVIITVADDKGGM